MNRPTKDLFDDTSMTFGEHLEVLRKHLILAIIGLVIAVVICLFNGDDLVDFVRRPIDRALARYTDLDVDDDVGDGFAEQWGLDTLLELFSTGKPSVQIDEETGETYTTTETIIPHPDEVKVRIPAQELLRALHKVNPDQFPAPQPGSSTGRGAANLSGNKKSSVGADNGSQTSTNRDQSTNRNQNSDNAASRGNNGASGSSATQSPPQQIVLTLQASEFAQFQATVEQSRRAVTLNVQEAFLTYVKVSLISGAVLASPWIFYQMWLFVAAGLYPHERKYVYVYGGMSLFLFLAGAAFCFFAVFPFVLNFLLKFNATLEIAPQIRISEWISFAVMLPLMFGVSFQLPLAMLFLERISIFQVEMYQQQRRMAILVIAILSMLLTPADPMSMLLMMFPLILLYELGIKLCKWTPKTSPLEPVASA